MLNLWTPFCAGGLQTQNRLVFPPMMSAKPTDEGRVTDALVRHYSERCVDGCIGLLITEHAFVSIEGKALPRQLSIADDGDIAGLAGLTRAIHKNGSKVVAQLSHAGARTNRACTGMASIGPTTDTFIDKCKPDMGMAKADIERVIGQFAAAAVRARNAGFDGVEIHSAHGYLLNQFYSPLTNRRVDNYGGCVENRVRIHEEIARAIKAATGRDYPVFLRLGICDYDMPEGNTMIDAVAACNRLKNAGIDVLDISGGHSGYRAPKGKEHLEGYFADDAKVLKQESGLPVLLTGGISSTEAADRLLSDGCADLIGIGRGIYNDKDWAHRAMLDAQRLCRTTTDKSCD